MDCVTFRYLYWYRYDGLGRMGLRGIMSLTDDQSHLSMGAYLSWRAYR